MSKSLFFFYMCGITNKMLFTLNVSIVPYAHKQPALFDKILTKCSVSACGLLLAGSKSGHASAVVTGWTSPQRGQLWHPGV